MSQKQEGPDYFQRMQYHQEGHDCASLRTRPSSLDYAFALLVSVFIAAPVTFYVAVRGGFPESPSSLVALYFVGMMLGSTAVCVAAYGLLVQSLRRRIVLDRRQDAILMGRREFAPMTDIQHVEIAAGPLLWRSLVLVFKDGRRMRLLKYPPIHPRAVELAQTLAEFLRVPCRDYSLGDYATLLQLHLEQDRLTMSAPNQRVGRWFGWVTWTALVALFVFLVIPAIHDPGASGRGAGLLITLVGMGVYSAASRVFRRRIVLDLTAREILVGRRLVGRLKEVRHVGLNIGKSGHHRLALVLEEGRRIDLIKYDWYPPSTVTVASTIANFLGVQVQDYYYDDAHAEERAREAEKAGR